MRRAAGLLLLIGAAATPATATAKVTTRHHRVRHHYHHYHTPPPPMAARPKVDANAASPAPVPNENMQPPEGPPPSTDPSFHPQQLQLHYPPVGMGYVPGSSPQAMDDYRTEKVPGVMIRVPLVQSPTPTPP